MPAGAAGTFRRTPAERSDQRVSWKRTDQAFFASGACHILAWVCRESYPDQPIRLAAMLYEHQRQVLHVYATWNHWAFDYCGWNPEPELLAANAEFEGHPVERTQITVDLAEFCKTHFHRLPQQYWRDLIPRAREYVNQHVPPWMSIFA
jgi:hypothetical protein